MRLTPKQTARDLGQAVKRSTKKRRVIAKITSLSGLSARETDGYITCTIAGETSVTVSAQSNIDLAVNDYVFITPDPAMHGRWVFDGFYQGSGGGNNADGAVIPWTYSPGVTSPPSTDLELKPATGQSVVFPSAAKFSSVDLQGNADALILDGDGDTTISAPTPNQVDFEVNGIDRVTLTASALTLLESLSLVFNSDSGENAIYVPDNQAVGFYLNDLGDTEYLRLITTNTQPVIVFNEGGADIDFRVEASGEANALVVRGSDGNVGIGTASPSRDLTVGSGSGNALLNLYAGTSGYSGLMFGDALSGAAEYEGYIRYYHGGDEMQFFTAHNQRAVIDSSGNVGIGTPTPGRRLAVSYNGAAAVAEFVNSAGNGHHGIQVVCGEAANPDEEFIWLADGDGDEVGVIIGDGAGGVDYNSASDKRLKRILGPLLPEEARAALQGVQPIRYQGKNARADASIKVGFGAQDLAGVTDGVARYSEETDLWSMNYSRLTAYLWAGWQYHHAKMTKIEKRVMQLEQN